MENAKYTFILTIHKTFETLLLKIQRVFCLWQFHTFSVKNYYQPCSWELWILPTISKQMWWITLSDCLASCLCYLISRLFCKKEFTWIPFYPLNTGSTFFFLFLETLLTICFSNDLAQDVLVLFWSKLLVTHSTLGVQAMV